MRGSMKVRILLAMMLLLPAAGVSSSVEVVSSIARALPSVSNLGGIALVPVGTQPGSYGDLAPIQLFEITKPANQSITIARMFTSCTCVQLEADRRTYGPGERAILRLRNIQATPPGGMTYALYVQLSSPTNITLRYDTYVQSSQFVPAEDGAPPTRGNIVADGVLPQSANMPVAVGADIDVIVPKAENYIPDTSEYSARKRAEQESLEKTTASKPDTAKSGVQPLDRPRIRSSASSGSSTDSSARDNANTAESAAVTPEMPQQLKGEIDAAISRVEREYSRAGQAGAGQGAQDRDAAGYTASADLSTGQSQKYQAEAGQIGRDILNPPPSSQTANTAGARSSSAGDGDSFWRTPRPRGAVRTAGSASRPEQSQPQLQPRQQPAGPAQTSQASQQPQPAQPFQTIQQFQAGQQQYRQEAAQQVQSFTQNARNAAENVKGAVDSAQRSLDAVRAQ